MSAAHQPAILQVEVLNKEKVGPARIPTAFIDIASVLHYNKPTPFVLISGHYYELFTMQPVIKKKHHNPVHARGLLLCV